MEVKYYILNGVSASGKDTFTTDVLSFLSYKFNGMYMRHFSSVEFVKECAEYIGWDGEKNEKGRNFLSGLKHLMTGYDDIPFKDTISRVETVVQYTEEYAPDINTLFVFIDVREPEEVEKYKDYFNAKTILIRNPSAEEKVFNESDLNVLDYDYDIVIWNNSTKEHLKELAKEFVENETKE